MNEVNPDLLKILACPISGSSLVQVHDHLVSREGHKYAVVEGVPVLLVSSAEQTLHVAQASLDRSNGTLKAIDARAPDLYLETLGISEDQKDLTAILYQKSGSRLSVISTIIAATSGYAYAHLISDQGLSEVPIPEIPLPHGNGEHLLDIGCNFGRWTISAARKGYKPVGIDPSLGAVLAAKDLCSQMNIDAFFVVADARYLPFKNNTFDFAFSYSVLQHLSEDDVKSALRSVAKTVRPGGVVKIQMAAKFGVRSLQHQIKRRFTDPTGFQVRYWTISDLKNAYTTLIGETRISVDCYFGLGWQFSDWRYVRPIHRPILLASELMRRLSYILPPLKYVADSVFLESKVLKD